MKNRYISKLLILGVITVFWGCSSDDDGTGTEEQEIIVSGEADFSTYVAVGNSLTAGFTDGALFRAGQMNSLPNILAGQFALAGGGEFTQPLMNDNVGGATLQGNVILNPRLYFDPNTRRPAVLPATPSTEIGNIQAGPYNNMGVPGAKSFHFLANGYGNIQGLATGQANPYFVRMASSPNTSVIADAAAQNPTFFTYWSGNNDVLGYATTGGDGTNPITNINLFTGAYTQGLDALMATASGGVVANIPDVTAVPFFTTVPYNPVPLDAATASMLNQAYAQYNGGIQQALANQAISSQEAQLRTISFAQGQNAVVINDETLTNLSGFGLPSIRQTTSRDLLTLTSSSFIGTLVNSNPQQINGLTVPLADKWVLLPAEQTEIKDATTAFNAVIRSAAQSNGLAFVDANAILNQIASGGVRFNEFRLNSSLVFGGAFSLDGIHPTARGYAYLANQFMAAINTTYGSNLPPVKAADFNTLYSPDLR